MPIPSVSRPLESTSIVAHSFARTTGLRCGRIRMPVASRTVDVSAAMYESHASGSGIGAVSSPGILPVGE